MSEAGKKVSYDPTPGLSYDPSQPVYWDPAALHGEVLRAFDICNGCRMCFKFCDSFPRLFELLDQRDHDVHTPRRRRDPGRSWTTASSASSARCSARTPRVTTTPTSSTSRRWCTASTPRSSGRGGGKPTLREQFLGDPDLSGKMARMSLGLANAMNKVAPAALRDGEGPGRRPARRAPRLRHHRLRRLGRGGRLGEARARRRRGALPDLLRAEQRHPARAGTPSRCSARTAWTCGW